MIKKIEVTRDTLTMHYPASWWRDSWREALVCGNGHMGASFYGGTRLQTIMITDGGLWYGGVEDMLPDVRHIYQIPGLIVKFHVLIYGKWHHAPVDTVGTISLGGELIAYIGAAPQYPLTGGCLLPCRAVAGLSGKYD